MERRCCWELLKKTCRCRFQLKKTDESRGVVDVVDSDRLDRNEHDLEVEDLIENSVEVAESGGSGGEQEKSSSEERRRSKLELIEGENEGNAHLNDVQVKQKRNEFDVDEVLDANKLVGGGAAAEEQSRWSTLCVDPC